MTENRDEKAPKVFIEPVEHREADLLLIFFAGPIGLILFGLTVMVSSWMKGLL